MSSARRTTRRSAVIVIVGLAAACLEFQCTTATASSFRTETEVGAPGRDVPTAVSVPANVRVPDMYRNVLDRMWLLSPTFRRQCARIERATNLVVVLAGQPVAPFSGVRARTAIELRRDGLRVANVELNPALRDQFVELLAHEFEHILEWLDGVDYVASSSRDGVSHGSAGAVETMRAIAVGRQVAGEVSAANATTNANASESRRAGRNAL